MCGISWTEFNSLVSAGDIKENQINEFSATELNFANRIDPDRIGTFWNDFPPKSPSDWMASSRLRGISYVKDFLVVKKEIVARANEFAAHNFRQRFRFSVHIRGTDWNCASPIKLEHYFSRLELKRLGWAPSQDLSEGIFRTYDWVFEQLRLQRY